MAAPRYTEAAPGESMRLAAPWPTVAVAWVSATPLLGSPDLYGAMAIPLLLGAALACTAGAMAWRVGPKAWLALVCATLLTALSATMAWRDDREEHLYAQRLAVMGTGFEIRSALTDAIHDDAALLKALEVHLVGDPEMSQEAFRDIAGALLRDHHRLRNVALAPDLVIRYVHPLEGNEAALGLDYQRDVPAQRADVLRAYAADDAIVAGPVDLVQGGRGVLVRRAIRFPGSDAPWGLAATVLDETELLEAAGLVAGGTHGDLDVALATTGDDGGPSAPFYGEAEVFERGVVVPVQLPGTQWWLAARPTRGWDLAGADAVGIGASHALLWIVMMGAWWVRASLVEERDRLLVREREALTASRDAAVAANEAKTRFLANMSHEIRTPMNGVLGALQVLQASDLSPVQAEYAGIVDRSARSLLRIVDDLLDHAMIEEGRLTLVPQPTDVSALVHETADLLRPEATRKGLELEVTVVPGMPEYVEIDPVRVGQILANLCANALKFTVEGGIMVRARWFDGLLEIGVSDTGIGIDAEALPRIFDAFEQADASTRREYGGTGLGITICRQLAQAMNGRLTATSTPGRGSRFVVTVPAPVARGAQPLPPIVDLPARAYGRRVLLVEDNAINTQVAIAMLERLGLVVTAVTDGAAAQAHADEADLVFMDVHMPGTDGLQTTRALRAAGYDRPIVAVTASVLPHDLDACREAGMDDVIGKPLDLRRVVEVCDAHLGRDAGA